MENKKTIRIEFEKINNLNMNNNHCSCTHRFKGFALPSYYILKEFPENTFFCIDIEREKYTNISKFFLCYTVQITFQRWYIWLV